MSVEHHHEHAERNEQSATELEAAARERLAELRRSAEADTGASERAEAAREIIHKKPERAPEPTGQTESAPKPAATPRFDPKLNYAHTLAGLQRSLTPLSRGFSKVIHAPVIEKTSEALEKTIARPSVTAGATWTAVIVGGVWLGPAVRPPRQNQVKRAVLDKHLLAPAIKCFA
jgi:hypothetical protein